MKAKTIELKCNHCAKAFIKALNEYTRQTKRGKTNFYCCRTCCGFHVQSNLPDPAINPWTQNPEHLRRMGLAAQKANTIYSEAQRPFREMLRATEKRFYYENDLTIGFLESLWNHQGGRCAISGIPLDLRNKNKNVRPSIDRIDSAKGYLQGNVQIVSCALNWAKNSGSDDDLRDLLRLIVEHFPKKSLHEIVEPDI